MARSIINQNKIVLIARLILIVSTLVIGLTVFLVMKENSEKQLIQNLQATLTNIVLLERGEINGGIQAARTIATRPFLIDQVSILNRQQKNAQAQAAVQRGVTSFLETGPSALALFDRSGHKLAEAGHFVNEPQIIVPLDADYSSELLFKHGYFLLAIQKMKRKGHVIGYVVSEKPMPTLHGLLNVANQLGKTAELVMCAPDKHHGMHCFPSRLSPRPQRVKEISTDGQLLPMAYALMGKTGALVAKDYRDREVIAAYHPLFGKMLGVVLKVDSADLYAPVWRQVQYLFPLMVLLIMAAVLSLHWLLAPLVNKLVRSEIETRDANERLSKSEQRLRTLVDSVDEGIVAISEKGIIELFNPGAERMFSYNSEDVVGKNVSLLMPEPYRSEHNDYLSRYTKFGDGHVVGSMREVVARRGNGEIFPLELHVSQLEQGGQRGFIGILHDITVRKGIEAQVAHFANFDALTDLANRRLVQDRIQQAIVRAARARHKSAVMFVDLDGFKGINDAFGHDVGDQVLQVVGQRFSGCLRSEDTVGRQGGDEFIILLSSIESVEDAALVAKKILDGLSTPLPIAGQDVDVSASIGIAVYPEHGSDYETLMRNSDTAMYRAKKMHGPHYCFYKPVTDEPDKVPII